MHAPVTLWVRGREVSMRKLRFSERQIAFIPTKGATRLGKVGNPTLLLPFGRSEMSARLRRRRGPWGA